MDTIATFIKQFNLIIFLSFLVLYGYQIVYAFVAFTAKKRLKVKADYEHTATNNYAVVIAARNEEVVISQLIQSIKKQKYPQKCIDIFVIADNCTDQTASVARQAGAIVHERFNQQYVGKGYALDEMFKRIELYYGQQNYAGYFVFDADNLLDEHYITRMNQSFNKGYRVVTSYRNSKNFSQNWITSGYALWFLHEAEYLNLPRMVLNNSCAISGTGFLVSSDLIKENGGWIHHLLTEDIEFSVSQVLKGDKIGYCRSAVFYDEQPITFKQSWNQRMRWAKGFYQVFGHYGYRLFKGMLTGHKSHFSCYDMTMTILPAVLLTFASILVNGFVLFTAAFEFWHHSSEAMQMSLLALSQCIAWIYLTLLILGIVTTLTEWREIHSPTWKKLFYTVTFPFFMLTYVPISIVALFKNVTWKPITHTVAKSVDDVR